MCINDAVYSASDGRQIVTADSRMSKKAKAKPGRPCQRVLLVDRHAFMRKVAAAWINRCVNLEVCGTAGSPAQAFRAAKRLQPNLVVSEIMRPRDFGFIRELHRRHPRLPILVFSLQDEAVYGQRAREAGASGYLMKGAGGKNLVHGIRTLLRRRNSTGHRTQQLPEPTR